MQMGRKEEVESMQSMEEIISSTQQTIYNFWVYLMSCHQDLLFLKLMILNYNYLFEIQNI